MKKINEAMNIKLEIETDDINEISRLMTLAGLQGQLGNTAPIQISGPHTTSCKTCGSDHDTAIHDHETSVQDCSSYDEWHAQMINDGATVFKSMDPENPEAGVTAFKMDGNNQVRLGHYSDELEETRGNEMEYDWGHRKYSSTGSTGNNTPAATDFYGRGDLRVRMHGRGDNAIYNVLVKEWQEFLKEYQGKDTATAVIKIVRGMTPAHVHELDQFLQSSGEGKLIPYPKDPNRVVYVPKMAATSGNMERIVNKMFDKVEQEFGMQPFRTNDWKIAGDPSMLESLMEENSTLDKIINEWKKFLGESNQTMNKKDLIRFVQTNIDSDLKVMENSVGNEFDLIGFKKPDILILHDGLETFEVIVPEGEFEFNRETRTFDFSDHKSLFEWGGAQSPVSKSSEPSLYNMGMTISRGNYAKLLSGMTDSDLETECANQIYLSSFNANGPSFQSHWRLEMCQDEVATRDEGMYDRVMARAQQMK